MLDKCKFGHLWLFFAHCEKKL